MPQAPKPLCLIHFWNWKISPLSLLALWGNKKWPPSMKVQQIENYQNKMGLKGCNWSSMNAPCTQTPLSHPFQESGDFPFLTILALWSNKNLPPSIKMRQIENSQIKMGIKGRKWSSLNAPVSQLPSLTHFWSDFPFPNRSLS